MSRVGWASNPLLASETSLDDSIARPCIGGLV